MIHKTKEKWFTRQKKKMIHKTEEEEKETKRTVA
jgi:hypothetical protein